MLFPINGFNTESGVGLPSMHASYLYGARYQAAYARFPLTLDDRLMRRHLVTKDVLDASFTSLERFLEYDDERAINLAELLLRSATAYGEHDYSLGLVVAWTMIEALLQTQWDRYLEENRERDGAPLITSERKKRLNDRDITASIIAEVLSLAGTLPKALYDDVSRVRKARNGWMHDLKPVDREAAAKALETAERLFDHVDGLKLEMPKALHLTI